MNGVLDDERVAATALESVGVLRTVAARANRNVVGPDLDRAAARTRNPDYLQHRHPMVRAVTPVEE